MTGWTKGPWRAVKIPHSYKDGTDHRWAVEHDATDPNGDVLTVQIADWLTESVAHQIAAAQELYEALEATLQKYLDLVGSGDCGFWNPEEETQVKRARAALAKARGETR